MFELGFGFLTTRMSFLVLAVFVCIASCLVAAKSAGRGKGMSGKIIWTMSALVTTGFGIWATHSTALLNHAVILAPSFDMFLAAASLLAAVGGMVIGLTFVLVHMQGSHAAIGGAVFGLSVVAMQYMDIVARAEGQLEPSGCLNAGVHRCGIDLVRSAHDGRDPNMETK